MLIIFIKFKFTKILKILNKNVSIMVIMEHALKHLKRIKHNKTSNHIITFNFCLDAFIKYIHTHNFW